MSDGFDKEAEREKLREKLADDEQKREHTQRMSELLLKGATMTNRHCEACGDPIFRHDGREFCPTCGNEVGGAAEGDEVSADANETAADAAGAAENDSVDVAPADSVDAESTDAGSVEADPNETAPPRSPSQEASSQGSASQGSAPPQAPTPPQTPTPPQRSGTQRPEAGRSTSQRSETRQSPPARSADDAGGIGAARASLTRTLTRFARAAEETDDPRRARDHLEAAREAAEALAALD